MQPSNTGLVAVLLITRSRPGPKLVFHYPPNPTKPLGVARAGATSTDSDSDSDSDLEPEIVRLAIDNSTTSPQNGDASDNRLFGYSIDSLEKVLSPGRWSDRKKFEICVDDLTFVGHPIYATEDGRWSKKRPTDDPPAPLDSSTGTLTKGQQTPVAVEDFETTQSAQITITGPETPGENLLHDFTHIPASLDSQTGQSLATSLNSNSTTSAHNQDRLNMFHVVFVLSSGSTISSQDVYHRIARKFSKALNYCQKQSNYVTVETRKIMDLKSKAKIESSSPEFSNPDLIQHSELAWALKTLQESLAANIVAGIRLNGAEMSLQLASKLSSHHEGALGPHSGLLLLEEKHHLLQELVHLEASPLAYFIREHTPNKNLQKHASNLNLPINDVLYLAHHLVKWRKARIIMPLRPSSQFVTNSDANLDDIFERTPQYSRKYTALPSLPHILKILSGRPIKYGLLVPSRDHRGPYMDLLADLVRDDFVVQLNTYGWLCGTLSANLARDLTIARPSATPASLLSPHLRPVDDDTLSVSSERTAFQRASTPLSQSDVVEHEHTIVLDPNGPTVEEARLIEQIRDSTLDQSTREMFMSIVPYLDGDHAFEEISAREGLKRAHVERALEALEGEGHLVTFRSAL